MIYNYLDAIAQSIKHHLPILDKSIYLAKIDDEGRILVKSSNTQNEYLYAGIKDNEGNYFYIRHRDGGEIKIEETNNYKKVSCNHVSLTSKYELKLVACVKNWCPYNAEEMLKRALMNAHIGNDGSILPKIAVIDSLSVMQEESPKPKQFDKNLIFVSVEFDLLIENHYY